MIRSAERKAKDRKALRMIVLVTQIGICMMVPVFLCVFAGQWASRKLDNMLIFPLFLLIGILAGFRSSWQMISRFTGLKFGISAARNGQEPASDSAGDKGGSEGDDLEKMDQRDQ